MMKLSIVIGLNESNVSQQKVNDTISSYCEYLKPLGYDGVELSLLKPELLDKSAIEDIINSYDIEIPALGTGGTFIRYGYSLGHHDSEIRQKAIKRIRRYIEFASEFESKVIIGLIRGRYHANSSIKKEKLNIISSLKECVYIAEDYNLELLFEPINQFEIDSFNTILDSLNLISEINSSTLKLLIDTFHLNLEEDPGFIWDYLTDITSYVSHIHLADTNRRAPGTGHFDFRAFLNIFKNAGYSNYVSLETIMKPSFEEVATEGAEYIEMILNT